MKTTAVGRIWAFFAVGALTGCLVHLNELHWAKRGRAAYVAYYGQYFDKHIAVQKPVFIVLMSCMIVVGMVIGLYELVALVLSKLLGDFGIEASGAGGNDYVQPR